MTTHATAGDLAPRLGFVLILTLLVGRNPDAAAGEVEDALDQLGLQFSGMDTGEHWNGYVSRADGTSCTLRDRSRLLARLGSMPLVEGVRAGPLEEAATPDAPAYY